VKWSGSIAAGSESKQQFAFEDFFATALDLAGLNPSHWAQTDGDSIVPTLIGSVQTQKKFVYHEFCGPNEKKGGWGQALRVGDWSGVCVGPKLTNNAAWPVCTSSSFLLYDLVNDVGQNSNVAAANPAVVASMMASLQTVRTNGGYCGETTPTSTIVSNLATSAPVSTQGVDSTVSSSPTSALISTQGVDCNSNCELPSSARRARTVGVKIGVACAVLVLLILTLIASIFVMV